MVRKLALVATTALCAMGAFGTSTALAGSNYACALDPNGVAGQITPGVGLTPSTGGSYTFNGNATCSVDGGAPQTAAIQSTGRFNNIICGTGNVYDGVALITAPGISVEAGYHIEFFGTVGALVVDWIKHDGVTTPATGGGAVQIRPKTGDCQSGVTEFFVSGGFAASH